jgi:hypothetical protein
MWSDNPHQDPFSTTSVVIYHSNIGVRLRKNHRTLTYLYPQKFTVRKLSKKPPTRSSKVLVWWCHMMSQNLELGKGYLQTITIQSGPKMDGHALKKWDKLQGLTWLGFEELMSQDQWGLELSLSCSKTSIVRNLNLLQVYRSHIP